MLIAYDTFLQTIVKADFQLIQWFFVFIFGSEVQSAPKKHIGYTCIFYKPEALSVVCTPATGRPSYEILMFCATERMIMRSRGFERDNVKH